MVTLLCFHSLENDHIVGIDLVNRSLSFIVCCLLISHVAFSGVCGVKSASNYHDPPLTNYFSNMGKT